MSLHTVFKLAAAHSQCMFSSRRGRQDSDVWLLSDMDAQLLAACVMVMNEQYTLGLSLNWLDVAEVYFCYIHTRLTWGVQNNQGDRGITHLHSQHLLYFKENLLDAQTCLNKIKKKRQTHFGIMSNERKTGW